MGSHKNNFQYLDLSRSYMWDFNNYFQLPRLFRQSQIICYLASNLESFHIRGLVNLIGMKFGLELFLVYMQLKHPWDCLELINSNRLTFHWTHSIVGTPLRVSLRCWEHGGGSLQNLMGGLESIHGGTMGIWNSVVKI